MNFITIDGPTDILIGLEDIPGTIIEFNSAEELPDGNIRIAGYATDDAITEIESRGATVNVVENNEALQARLDQLYEIIDSSEPPDV
jgi:hypothetical protein